MNGLKRVIWAVDPLEADKRTRNRSIHILRDLVKRVHPRVKPVYVLSDALLSHSMKQGKLASDFTASSKRALDRFVKQAGVSEIDEPQVLVCTPSSKDAAAEMLDRFAQSMKADLILVTSHGGSALSHAFFGSFAETLTMHSKTPILISGPEAKHLTDVSRILFPTDFTKSSEAAFEEIKELARNLGSRVTLFHAVLGSYEPVVQSGVGLLGGGFIPIGDRLEPRYERQKRLASSWIFRAKREGVEVDIDFDVRPMGVSSSILTHAKRMHIGLIAMASQSGEVAATLLGSVSRDVCRGAPCPVLILRT